MAKCTRCGKSAGFMMSMCTDCLAAANAELRTKPPVPASLQEPPQAGPPSNHIRSGGSMASGAILVSLGLLLAFFSKGLRVSPHQSDVGVAPFIGAAAALFLLPGVVLWRGRWPHVLTGQLEARVAHHRLTVQILTSILGVILVVAPIWVFNIGRAEGGVVMAVLVTRYGATLLLAPLVGLAAFSAVLIDRKNRSAGRVLTLVVATVPSVGSILGLLYGAYVYYWYWGQPRLLAPSVSTERNSAATERAV